MLTNSTFIHDYTTELCFVVCGEKSTTQLFKVKNLSKEFKQKQIN